MYGLGDMTDQQCLHLADSEAHFALVKLKILSIPDNPSPTNCGDHHNVNPTEMEYMKLCTRRVKEYNCNGGNKPKIKASTETNNNCLQNNLHQEFPWSWQMRRIRIEAGQYRLEKAIKKLEEEEKQLRECSRDCADYREKMYQIAQKMFISHKVKLLSKSSFIKNLEKHLFQKDSITLLGEIVQDSIPPSASSEQVWRAMSNRLEGMQQ